MSGGSQTGDTLGKALASVSMHHLNPIRAAHLCPVMSKHSDKALNKILSGVLLKENSPSPLRSEQRTLTKGYSHAAGLFIGFRLVR